MINQANVMYKQLIKLTGTDGFINDIPCRFLVTENNDSDENGYDLKNIITDQPIKQGDYITIDDELYMIIDIKKVNESAYIKGTYRKVLKITFQSTLKDVYAVVDKVKGVYVKGQEITEVHDEYTFIIPKSLCSLTSISAKNNLIIYAGGSYDAISIDDSKDGILIITGRFNNIYNLHLYMIELNEINKVLVEGGTYQISAICKDNGTTVTSIPTLTYSSSDVTIASVSDSGLVTALKQGNAEITVTYNGVSAKLSLLINAKPVTPVLSYSYTLSNGVSLRLAEGTSIICTKTINGTTDTTFTGASLSYTLDSIGSSALSAGKMTVIVGTTIPTVQVRNKQTSSDTVKTIHITVKESSTGTIIVDNLAITLKNGTT